MNDMSTKSQNSDTSEERVHESDKSIHDDDDIQEYKKPWVSLTDEEIDYIWGVTPPDYENFFEFPRAIEAKLKEKNT